MVMNADGSNPRKSVDTSAGSDRVRGWQYQRITVMWNRQKRRVGIPGLFTD
jgi:hypothetical protein